MSTKAYVVPGLAMCVIAGAVSVCALGGVALLVRQVLG